MNEEINKSIDSFSKGNKDLAKILTLFAAQIIVILAKDMVTLCTNSTLKFGDEMSEASKSLINYYDLN